MDTEVTTSWTECCAKIRLKGLLFCNLIGSQLMRWRRAIAITLRVRLNVHRPIKLRLEVQVMTRGETLVGGLEYPGKLRASVVKPLILMHVQQRSVCKIQFLEV